jgi:hypothetical protein
VAGRIAIMRIPTTHLTPHATALKHFALVELVVTLELAESPA